MKILDFKLKLKKSHTINKIKMKSGVYIPKAGTTQTDRKYLKKIKIYARIIDNRTDSKS